MRVALRNKLVAKIPEVGGRVYEPFMAGPTTAKPYIVLKAGGENDSKMRYGFDVPFEVWMYVDRTSQVVLDELGDKIINVLNRKETKTATGYVFSLAYDGCSEDFYDEDWKALTRRLDFSTVRVRGG